MKIIQKFHLLLQVPPYAAAPHSPPRGAHTIAVCDTPQEAHELLATIRRLTKLKTTPRTQEGQESDRALETLLGELLYGGNPPPDGGCKWYPNLEYTIVPRHTLVP